VPYTPVKLVDGTPTRHKGYSPPGRTQ
jgi:hypothetical protein